MSGKKPLAPTKARTCAMTIFGNLSKLQEHPWIVFCPKMVSTKPALPTNLRLFTITAAHLVDAVPPISR